MNLSRREIVETLEAVQGDANTRAVELHLFDNGAAWNVPEGVTAAVAFRKPDGHKGLYDTLPDGTAAVSIEGSTVTAILAPQVLTCPGSVLASVVFYDKDMDALATFPFQIIVEKNPAAGEQISNNYYTLQNLDQVNQAYNALVERMGALEQGGTGGGSGDYVLTQADKQEIAEMAAEMVEVPEGAAGKSAYEYAKEGGYTGTEAEFTQKLASEPSGGLPYQGTVTTQAELDAATTQGIYQYVKDYDSGLLQVINAGTAIIQTLYIYGEEWDSMKFRLYFGGRWWYWTNHFYDDNYYNYFYG